MCIRENNVFLLRSSYDYPIYFCGGSNRQAAKHSTGGSIEKIVIYGFISSYMGRSRKSEIHAGMPMLHLSSCMRLIFFFPIVTHLLHAISAYEKKFMSHYAVTGKFTFKNVVSRFVITVPCIRKFLSKPPFTQFLNAAENCGIF